jgi:hypothetical protein
MYADIEYITVAADFVYLFHLDIEYIAVAVGFEIYKFIDLYLGAPEYITAVVD